MDCQYCQRREAATVAEAVSYRTVEHIFGEEPPTRVDIKVCGHCAQYLRPAGGVATPLRAGGTLIGLGHDRDAELVAEETEDRWE